MRRSSTTNSPGRELRRQAADVHRPLHELRAFALGPLAQVGPEIDRKDRCQQRRDDGDENSEQAEQHAAEAPAFARVLPWLVRLGFRLVPVPAFRPLGYSITTSTRPASTEVPGVTADFHDRSGLRRAQLVLHLHRFDDDDALTGGHGIAGVDEHADDATRHGRDDRLLPRSPAVVGPAAAARAPVDDDRHGAATERTSTRRAARRRDLQLAAAASKRRRQSTTGRTRHPLGLDFVRLAIDDDHIAAGPRARP